MKDATVDMAARLASGTPFADTNRLPYGRVDEHEVREASATAREPGVAGSGAGVAGAAAGGAGEMVGAEVAAEVAEAGVGVTPYATSNAGWRALREVTVSSACAIPLRSWAFCRSWGPASFAAARVLKPS